MSKFREQLEKKLKGYPAHLLGNPYIFITDTETTGFSKINNDLIALSGEVRDFDLNLKDEITLYAKPHSRKRWNNSAEKVHGFSFSEAQQFAERRTTCIQLLNFLKPFKHEGNHPLLFVSHDNNGFDFNFTEWLFRMENLHFSFWKVFDREFMLSTIKMAKEQGYAENKLNIWSDRLGFELDHHEACSDRMGCSEVFKHLVETRNEMETSK